MAQANGGYSLRSRGADAQVLDRSSVHRGTERHRISLAQHQASLEALHVLYSELHPVLSSSGFLRRANTLHYLSRQVGFLYRWCTDGSFLVEIGRPSRRFVARCKDYLQAIARDLLPAFKESNNYAAEVRELHRVQAWARMLSMCGVHFRRFVHHEQQDSLQREQQRLFELPSDTRPSLLPKATVEAFKYFPRTQGDEWMASVQHVDHVERADVRQRAVDLPLPRLPPPPRDFEEAKIDLSLLDYGTVPTCIGQGGEADVYRATYRGRVVAVKVMKAAAHSPQLQPMPLLRLVFSYQHPHVLPLLGWAVQPRVVLVTAFARRGSLWDFLRSHGAGLTARAQLLLAQQCAMGVAHIRGVDSSSHDTPHAVHNDIKPENFLVDDDPTAEAGLGVRVMLADFGLSAFKDRSTDASRCEYHELRDNGGTLRWMDPAYVQRSGFADSHAQRGRAYDVYALGLVFWQLTTLCLPFPHDTDDVVRERLKTHNLNESVVQQAEVRHPCAEFRQLVERCTGCERDRPSAQDLVDGLTQMLHHADTTDQSADASPALPSGAVAEAPVAVDAPMRD